MTLIYKLYKLIWSCLMILSSMYNMLLEAIKTLKNESVKVFELIPQLSFESLNEEIKTFMDKCTGGVFYDHCLEFDSFKDLTRDNVKEIMLEVLFSRNHYEKYGKKIIPYKENKNRFKSKYPGIYEIIECLKQRNTRA